MGRDGNPALAKGGKDMAGSSSSEEVDERGAGEGRGQPGGNARLERPCVVRGGVCVEVLLERERVTLRGL